jgi:exopolysaccharide biosynthesis polyprenyl glycosylphosphotransferase
MNPPKALPVRFHLRPIWLLGRLHISERRLLLRFGDYTMIAASLIGSLLLWLSVGGVPLSWDVVAHQWIWMTLIGGGWIAWLILGDTYSLWLAARFPAIALRILGGTLVVTFIFFTLFFVTSREAVTALISDVVGPVGAVRPPLRFAPAVAIILGTVLLLVWRGVYAWSLSGPLTRRRILILGAGKAGEAICRVIRSFHYSYYEIVGFIDDDPVKQHALVEGVQVLNDHAALPKISKQQRIDEIVVAISSEVRGSLFQALMDCHEIGVHIVPMPLLYEELTGRIAVEHVGSQWYITLPLQPLNARTATLAFKRLFDIMAGLVLGLVFVILLPFVALAIKLDSPGPVFYRQERVGRYGRRFRVWKLRSMCRDAEQTGKAQWALRNDTRITSVGRLLRRTRIDELPQAWNILCGEMSVVGPRPERAQFIDQLQHQIPFYRTRLAAKPGLTGWAQINYGYSSTIDETLVKLQYDLYYLKHQSLWFDLLIVLRTISVVLRMKGQ